MGKPFSTVFFIPITFCTQICLESHCFTAVILVIESFALTISQYYYYYYYNYDADADDDEGKLFITV